MRKGVKRKAMTIRTFVENNQSLFRTLPSSQPSWFRREWGELGNCVVQRGRLTIINNRPAGCHPAYSRPAAVYLAASSPYTRNCGEYAGVAPTGESDVGTYTFPLATVGIVNLVANQ